MLGTGLFIKLGRLKFVCTLHSFQQVRNISFIILVPMLFTSMPDYILLLVFTLLCLHSLISVVGTAVNRQPTRAFDQKLFIQRRTHNIGNIIHHGSQIHIWNSWLMKHTVMIIYFCLNM